MLFKLQIPHIGSLGLQTSAPNSIKASTKSEFLFELNSRINFEAERSGYYYLEAGSYLNQFTGKYFIGAYEDITQPEDPINDGAATFAIEGTPQLGQVLSISLTNSDPDGDGTPTVAWLASNQDGTWSQVGSDPQITISADLEGRQLIANVSYIDGDGFIRRSR